MKLPNLVIASVLLLLFLAHECIGGPNLHPGDRAAEIRGIYAIDFDAALKAATNNTPNAIVSRSKVHADRLDARRSATREYRAQRGPSHCVRVNHHGP